MENRNILQELTEYRLKVEKDGKSVIDIPGILCLPGLLAAPRLGIAGMIAAPLLGYNMHLENGDGKTVDVEKQVQKAAETVVNTAKETAKSIREEIEKAWQAASVEDPDTEENPETADAEEDPGRENRTNQEIVDELEKRRTEEKN